MLSPTGMYTTESAACWGGGAPSFRTRGSSDDAPPNNSIDHGGRSVIFLPCWCGECGTWQYMYLDVVFETIEVFPEEDT